MPYIARRNGASQKTAIRTLKDTGLNIAFTTANTVRNPRDIAKTISIPDQESVFLLP